MSYFYTTQNSKLNFDVKRCELILLLRVLKPCKRNYLDNNFVFSKNKVYRVPSEVTNFYILNHFIVKVFIQFYTL